MAKQGIFARMSIRRKLVLMVMLVSIIAIILVSLSFIGYEWYTFRQRMVDDLTVLTSVIGDNCSGALSFDDPTDAQEVLRALRAKDPIEFACLYSLSGDVLTTYLRDESGHIIPPVRIQGDIIEFQTEFFPAPGLGLIRNKGFETWSIEASDGGFRTWLTLESAPQQRANSTRSTR